MESGKKTVVITQLRATKCILSPLNPLKFNLNPGNGKQYNKTNKIVKKRINQEKRGKKNTPPSKRKILNKVNPKKNRIELNLRVIPSQKNK